MSRDSRRYHLGPLLPMAILRRAQCHAIDGDSAAMEEALAQALEAASDNVEVRAGAWGQCRATLSLVREQPAQALEELEAGVELVRGRPEALPWTFRGLWALLRTTQDAVG